MERRVTARGRRTQARSNSEDGTSFEVFYEEHWAVVVAVTRSLCRDAGVAEDLAQEAFLRAYGRWKRVSSLDRPDFWVKRVALNLAVSRFRRMAAEARAMARTHVVDRAHEGALPPEVDGFWRALSTLSARQAQVAALFYVDDLSISQIAGVLGCAEGTVKAHLHAARQRLRQTLASHSEVRP